MSQVALEYDVLITEQVSGKPGHDVGHDDTTTVLRLVLRLPASILLRRSV